MPQMGSPTSQSLSDWRKRNDPISVIVSRISQSLSTKLSEAFGLRLTRTVHLRYDANVQIRASHWTQGSYSTDLEGNSCALSRSATSPQDKFVSFEGSKAQNAKRQEPKRNRRCCWRKLTALQCVCEATPEQVKNSNLVTNTYRCP